MALSSQVTARVRSAAGLATLALLGCLTEPGSSGNFDLTVTGDLALSLSGTVMFVGTSIDGHESGYRLELRATGAPGYVFNIVMDFDGAPAVGTFKFQDFNAPAPCNTDYIPGYGALSASNGSASRYESTSGTVHITDVSGGQIRGDVTGALAREELTSMVSLQCNPKTGEVRAFNVPPATLQVSGTFEAKR
jgi:hypothetical protein